MTGRIFDIQGFSIHDGPGIRTVVFFSGCPLRCRWCQNPESHKMGEQLLFFRQNCSGCGRCALACPTASVRIEGGVARTDRETCVSCGACVGRCLNQARKRIGTRTDSSWIFDRVMEDRIYYEGSGGGVTLSGGEVLMQPSFAAEILRRCGEAGIHTAVETSGYGDRTALNMVAEYTDLFLYDIKHMDARMHRKGTGVDNDRILANLEYLFSRGKQIQIRVPLIGGYNDDTKSVQAVAEYLSGRVDCVSILPYHTMGLSKMHWLEKEDGKAERFTTPDETDLCRVTEVFRREGIGVQLYG